MVSTPYIDMTAILNSIIPVITSFLGIFIAFWLLKSLMGMLKELE